jgi:hypothetical protein
MGYDGKCCIMKLYITALKRGAFTHPNVHSNLHVPWTHHDVYYLLPGGNGAGIGRMWRSPWVGHSMYAQKFLPVEALWGVSDYWGFGL